MPIRPPPLLLMTAIAALVLACGCGNAGRAADRTSAQAQEDPVKRPPKPAKPQPPYPDPAYLRSSTGERWNFSARIGRAEPLAVAWEVGSVDRQERKVPAAEKRALPLILEVACISPPSYTTPGPLTRAATIAVLEPDTGAALATFTVAADCVYSHATKMTLSTDRGAVMESMEHLRTPLDAALDARLREDASTTWTVVARDAEGRIMLVQPVNGFAAASDVYAGSTVVSVMPHATYTQDPGPVWSTSNGSIAFDQPVALPAAEGAKPVRVPARFAAPSPLVVELMRRSPTFRDGPLSAVVAIHVFAKHTWKLLATVRVAKEGRYTSDTGDFPEQNGRSVYLTEHLRAALGKEALTYVRTVKDAQLTAIAVDKDGRTVVSETLYPSR